MLAKCKNQHDALTVYGGSFLAAENSRSVARRSFTKAVSCWKLSSASGPWANNGALTPCRISTQKEWERS